MKATKIWLKATDVSSLLEVSQTFAYGIISKLNKELEAQGYLVIPGKVPTKYFMEKFYGIEDVCEMPEEERVEWFHA
jgi:hypothetical protein